MIHSIKAALERSGTAPGRGFSLDRVSDLHSSDAG